MGKLFAVAYPAMSSLGVWMRIENEDWVRSRLAQRRRLLGGRANLEYFAKLEDFLTNAKAGDIEEVEDHFVITPLGVEE